MSSSVQGAFNARNMRQLRLPVHTLDINLRVNRICAHAAPELAAWITASGGWVDPRLIVTDSTTTGCRGVVASETLPLEDEYWILVPLRLTIDEDKAYGYLEDRFGKVSAT